MHEEAKHTITAIPEPPAPEENSEFAALDVAARAFVDAAGGLRVALRDDLVVRAAPIARRLARRYRDRGEPLEDLEQVALVGLLKAVDGYDPERGSFGGYLLSTVSGELKRHFRDRGWNVRVPRRVQELVAQVSHASARLTADLSRRPTVAELAEELGVSADEVAEALASASAYRPVSLNAPLPGEDNGELVDSLGMADRGMGGVEDRLTVAELLCRLPARERQLLALRFYGNQTQTEIAAAMGMSQMHASRLLTQALAWLRDALLSEDPVQWRAGRGAPDPDRLAVRTRIVQGAVLVELGGELDRDAVDQLRRALGTAIRLGPAPQLRVDLRAVPFVDAAAIAAILAAGESARRAGMRLSLVGARPYVAQALATAGLWPFLAGGAAADGDVPAAGGGAPGNRAGSTRRAGREVAVGQEPPTNHQAVGSTAHTALPPATGV
jgi:RNA polymerase sigma-B factor